MNPSTGTFISMDSYQGSIYDPVTLHKYLYANANPVMYTDPSGYMAFPVLAASMSISEVFSASWKFITYSSIVGAFTGAACSAIDSVLGGNDFSQVVQDAFRGLFVGAFWGCVVSALACYAVISPICMMFLYGAQSFFLASGMVGALVSAEEGNAAQSIFRAILGILAYTGTGKLIDSANVRILQSRYLSVTDFINQNVNSNFQQSVNDAFLSDAKVSVLEKNTIVYRYHGGQSGGKSFWYTPNQTANPAADLALPSGNTYQYMDVYIIPKGTTILEGTVAPNFGQPGGGYQYYVPDPSVVIKK